MLDLRKPDRLANILIIENHAETLSSLRSLLTLEGHHVSSGDESSSAYEILAKENIDLVLVSLSLGGNQSTELLVKLRQTHPGLLIIVLSDSTTWETAITATQNGAYGYVSKPIRREDVLITIGNALDQRFVQSENQQLKEALSMYDMGASIDKSLSSEEVLRLALETAYRLLQPDAAVLFMRLRGTETYQLEAFRTKDNKPVDECIGSPNFGALVKAHVRKQFVCAGDGDMDFYFRKKPANGKLYTFASIPIRHRDHVLGFINIYMFNPFQRVGENHHRLLSFLASKAAQAIETALLFEDLRDTFQQTIEGFARSLDRKDQYTAGHSERVKIYSLMIVDGLGISGHERDKIVHGSLLHDIGKLSVDLSALNNAKKLSATEIAQFRAHPVVGKEILEPISFLADLIPMVYHHHENFDGSGYPLGLQGTEIPLGARIVAVADTYDAMTSHRPYRRAMAHESAVKELKVCSNTQFDPQLVEVFLGEVEKHLTDGDVMKMIDEIYTRTRKSVKA